MEISKLRHGENKTNVSSQQNTFTSGIISIKDFRLGLAFSGYVFDLFR